mmetsp:Transcript_3284/g.9496  ORF Transcript_3284/g.9496 Transcript_3284/m.9496 type:complete len:237 (+) Transcript_3284:3-713(+)
MSLKRPLTDVLEGKESKQAMSRTMRGVPVPDGWSVVGDSLLFRDFGALGPEGAPGAPASEGRPRWAAFDFDGCLANTPLGGNDPTAWKMQFPQVPSVLRDFHRAGFRIAIITNESMDRLKKPEAIRNCILKKTGRLVAFVREVGVPCVVLCSCAKDEYRKPAGGAWHVLMGLQGAGPPDMAHSFFVGDAAGRKKDHSDSDKAFAAGVGLRFYTETDFFTDGKSEEAMGAMRPAQTK